MQNSGNPSLEKSAKSQIIRNSFELLDIIRPNSDSRRGRHAVKFGSSRVHDQMAFETGSQGLLVDCEQFLFGVDLADNLRETAFEPHPHRFCEHEDAQEPELPEAVRNERYRRVGALSNLFAPTHIQVGTNDDYLLGTLLRRCVRVLWHGT